MPTFANSSRQQLAYVPEANFGVIPVTGNPYALRNTGESLSFNLTKENDKEMNPSAELTSSTTTYGQADGDIKVHLQYAEYDRFLAALLRSAWSAYGTNGVGTTFSATVTAGTAGTVASTVTAGAAPTGANAFTTLQPGQWFRISMPGDANDGKLVRNSSSVAATATVITLDVNTPLSASAAVAGSSIATSRLSNGTTLQSFTIEKQLQDVNQFFTFRGMYVSKFSTTIASKTLTEGTFTFLGKDVLTSGTGKTLTTTRLTGAVAASNTYDIQNGVRGVGNLWENGVPLTSTSIKSISFDIDSTLRPQDAAGTLGLVGVGIGTFMTKGKLAIYFADGALYDKFIGDVYTSLVVSTQDSAGNGYVITLPKVMLSGGKVVAGSKDTDIMAEFDYTAYSDKTNANVALRKTMFIDRVGAAVAP
jgi:hypothetical protein